MILKISNDSISSKRQSRKDKSIDKAQKAYEKGITINDIIKSSNKIGNFLS